MEVHVPEAHAVPLPAEHVLHTPRPQHREERETAWLQAQTRATTASRTRQQTIGVEEEGAARP